MLFVRHKCRLRTELISSSGDQISPKIIQSFRYITLRMQLGWLAMTSSYQKFNSPYVKHHFPHHAGKHVSRNTRNGCLYYKIKTTQYFEQHVQTYVLAVECLQTNHSSLSNVLDKEPMKSIK